MLLPEKSTKKPPKAEKKAFNKVIKNDNGTNKKS